MYFEISRDDLDSSINQYPSILVSGIRPDIRQAKSGIRPDTGY
jgi:hypothetical protein